MIPNVEKLNWTKEAIIKFWQEKGYIKKSAREEFEEYISKKKSYSLDEIIALARIAIEEEYQRGYADGWENGYDDGCVDKS